ncbi:hypothetical protein C1645_775725 [Glomus cerebriforme]|uniref:Uncharacterized protein n=1 Tax=Glomus cerebriforme TaxID=658196 RepID=A0A397SPL7_9GLOM|nr:hypothetical protein C1645_775725 [Glomus cerebriforme]
MFDVLCIEKSTFIILGPNNNYIEITIPTAKEIADKHFKGNLNAYFLFQIDLKRRIKTLKSPKQFVEFTNNIPMIWEIIPNSLKNMYKQLSEELEKLNKSSELIIRSFNPKNSKRRQKENNIRHRKKKKKDDQNVSFTKPKTKIPADNSCPVIPSEPDNNIITENNYPYFGNYPEISLSSQHQFTETNNIVMENNFTGPDFGNYSEISPSSQFQFMETNNVIMEIPSSSFMETNIVMENTNLISCIDTEYTISGNYVEYFPYLTDLF